MQLEDRGVREEARFPTKLFALQCLEHIVAALQRSDKREHFDLHFARQHCDGKPRLLVQQVNDLLTIATMAIGASFAAVQVAGMELLHTVISSFARSEDPEGFEGSLLLELYQAQITSALRQALSHSAEDAVISPLLRCAACQTAVTFIRSGLLSDRVALSRIVNLLLGPLEREELATWSAIFNGRVTTSITLAHVHALASLYIAAVDAHTTLGQKTKESFPHPSHTALRHVYDDFTARHAPLAALFFKALHDYALVLTVKRTQIHKVKGFFFDGAMVTGVKDAFSLHLLDALLPACASCMALLPASRGEVVLSEQLTCILIVSVLGGAPTRAGLLSLLPGPGPQKLPSEP